jgi:uncharacterized membrane protein
MNVQRNSAEALRLDRGSQSFPFPDEGGIRHEETFVPEKELIRISRFWPWWRWLLTGLCVVGLAMTTFLSWLYLSDGSAIGCTGGSPCDQVLRSRWSTVGGVFPVSGLAAGLYLAMLIASLFIGPGTEPQARRMAWRAILVLVGAAGGSAAWFTLLQKWSIGAFCPYCMITHIVGLLLTALIIWRTFRQAHDLTELERAVAAPARTLSLVGAGLALAGILALCQVSFAPPPTYRAGEAQDNKPAVDLRSLPLVGSPEAQYVVALLFDYQCPHCQQMHFMLDEAMRRYNGKLAFALCPSPLSRQCNPYIPRDENEYEGSCELVKVGLTVWVAKREAFPAFNRWMFMLESGDRWRPRSLDDARAKAVELVGLEKFEAAQASPWIDRFMQASIRIYGGTIQGGNAVPKLVFGSRWVIPAVYDADDLVSILQNSLAVPKP